MAPSKASTTRYNIGEAKARFSELAQKALLGEEVIIAKGNKSVLKLVSLDTPKVRRKPGSAKGRIWMASDFDEMPDDFKDYGTPSCCCAILWRPFLRRVPAGCVAAPSELRGLLAVARLPGAADRGGVSCWY